MIGDASLVDLDDLALFRSESSIRPSNKKSAAISPSRLRAGYSGLTASSKMKEQPMSDEKTMGTLLH
jgi:hypothetical protein